MENSKIFLKKKIFRNEITEKFVGERGRINCSLRKIWFLAMVGYSICY